MFVMFLEQIIRNVSGNAGFTLPYWNYTDANARALPAQFRMPNDPVWRSLFRSDRNDGINRGLPIDDVGGSPLNLEAMRSAIYADSGTGDAGFCANLDLGLHGSVHVDIGNADRGMGAVPWAASDPIFWLHHCNIDRVWASWNRAGGRNPNEATFLNQRFTFVDGAGNRAPSTVRDVLDTSALGYVYDQYLDRPPGSAPFVDARVAFTTHATSRQASGQIVLGGSRTTVALAKQPITPQLRAVPADQNFFLRLENVRAAVQPGIAYDIYLDLPQGSVPSRSDPGYVGSTTFFGATAHGGHNLRALLGGKGRSYSLVATGAVRRLQDIGRLTSAPTVTLVPIGTPRTGAAPTIGSISLSSA
jgi:tyrosinase